MKLVAVLIAGMFSSLSSADAATYDELLKAIRIVETGGEPNDGIGAKGDYGKALGPFQIWKVYWHDAIEFAPEIGGKYEDCSKHEYSRKVIKAYMTRYAKQALADKDWETIARIHNGGPKGHKKEATLGYWRKVKKQLK